MESSEKVELLPENFPFFHINSKHFNTLLWRDHMPWEYISGHREELAKSIFAQIKLWSSATWIQ